MASKYIIKTSDTGLRLKELYTKLWEIGYCYFSENGRDFLKLVVDDSSLNTNYIARIACTRFADSNDIKNVYKHEFFVHRYFAGLTAEFMDILSSVHSNIPYEQRSFGKLHEGIKGREEDVVLLQKLLIRIGFSELFIGYVYSDTFHDPKAAKGEHFDGGWVNYYKHSLTPTGEFDRETRNAVIAFTKSCLYSNPIPPSSLFLPPSDSNGEVGYNFIQHLQSLCAGNYSIPDNFYEYISGKNTLLRKTIN